MKNINNKSILSAGLFAVLALFTMLLSPTSAKAYVTQGAYTYCDGPCLANGTLTNNGNYYNGNGNFNPNVLDKNSVPTIYSTNPEEVGTSDGTKTITIFGTGFKPDSIARWNSVDRPTTFVSANKLLIRLDPEDTATPGKYQVSVVNPSADGGKFSNQKVVNVVKGKVNNLTGGVLGANTSSNGASSTSGSSTQNGSSSLSTKTTTTKSTAKATTTKKVATSNTSKVSTATEKLNKNLVAGVINGDNSMMPNSVIEWLVLFALILFSVLLFRKLWLTPVDHAKPLKHA